MSSPINSAQSRLSASEPATQIETKAAFVESRAEPGSPLGGFCRQ